MIAIERRADTSSEVAEDGFRKEARFNGQREEGQTRCPGRECHVNEQRHVPLKHQESVCLEC